MKHRIKRQGFSIPLAILGGGMIAIVMTALSFYSQGEMRSVRQMLDGTTGEYLSYSGMIWAYDKLCRDGRWYQPADNSIKDRGHQWQNSWQGPPELAIPGAGGADAPQLLVFLDEVKSPHTLNIPGKTINPGNATPGLPLLDHIKVLALARSGNEETLLYGKLVMMPEPLLNSRAVAGMPEDNPGDPEAGEYVVRVPTIQNTKTGYGAKVTPGYIWSQDIDLTDRVMIKTIPVAVGQKVRMEDYVVTMNTEWIDSSGTGWATQEPKQRARYDGVVKEILVKVGDIVTEGTDLMIIKKDPAQKTVKLPLIKMVRVTKVPRDIYRGLKLENMADRFRVYAHVQGQNQEFLRNVDPAFSDSSVESFLKGKDSATLSEKDLNDFPATTPAGNTREAMNLLVRQRMFGFVPPFAFDAKRSKDFSGSATYVLGVQPREITPQLKELLEIHGKKHKGDAAFYLNQLDTLPKKMKREQNKDLYVIRSDKPDGATKEFLDTVELLNSKSGNRTPLGSDPKEYIKSLSNLKDGAVYANIYLNEDTPWTPQTFKDKIANGSITDPENYFFWKNAKGEEGYWKYAPEHAITIKKVDVPYFYENPTPIDQKKSLDPNEPESSSDNRLRLKVSDLMNFHRKFFDEAVPTPPADELRPDDDIEDTPQAPGPPDATGAIFSGVSS